MRARRIPVGRAAVMMVALLLFAHMLAGAMNLHGATGASDGPGAVASAVPGPAPLATSVVGCQDGGSCMNADRPMTQGALLLDVTLFAATLVLVARRCATRADGWRRRHRGPAPPWVRLIPLGILLI